MKTKHETILVSACLLGAKVRYDGEMRKTKEALELLNYYDIIPICPEMDGGLPCPRTPSEISGERVVDKEGRDVSEYFKKGASLTLQLVSNFHIKIAILKDGSPSCGSTNIYDGTFTGKKIEGMGVTARALKEAGVRVYSENNIADLLSHLREKAKEHI